MASKNFTGYLRDPMGEYSEFNKWTFIHMSTTGETVTGSTSILCIPEDGFYNIDLEYGYINIRTKDKNTRETINQGTYVINSETLVTTLPGLLNAEVPVSDPIILELEAILADAETAATEAEEAAVRAEEAATEAEDALAVLPDPDVNISFNNGIGIEQGYPDRGDVTFTRASATGNINKSGVVVDLAIDEPAITSDGLSVYGDVTNEFLYSEDFTDGYWSKVSVTANKSVTEPSILPVSSFCSELIESVSTTSSHNLRKLSLAVVSNDGITMQFFAKAKSGNRYIIARLESVSGESYQAVFDPSNGEVFSASVEIDAYSKSLGNGWFFYSLTSTVDDDDNAISQAKIALSADGISLTYEGDGVSGIYIDGMQVTSGIGTHTPYIKTTTAPATRAADIASIPMMNNMPAAGQPFTIAIDCSLGGGAGANRWCVDGADYVSIRDGLSGATVSVRIFGDSTTLTMPVGLSGTFARWVVSFDGTNFSLYANGQLAGGGAIIASITPDLLGSMYIGKWSEGNQFNNGELKNFKIWHSALTAAQIARLGSAE